MTTAEELRKQFEPKKRREFSQEDAEAALRLAATIGVRAACRELKLSSSVMRRFQRKNPELWSDLRAGNRDLFTQKFADRAEELASDYATVEETAIARAAALIRSGELDAKELAALIKAMSSGRGVAVQNARQARGEPDKSATLQINFPQLETAISNLLEQGAPAPQLPPVPVPNEAE